MRLLGRRGRSDEQRVRPGGAGRVQLDEPADAWVAGPLQGDVVDRREADPVGQEAAGRPLRRVGGGLVELGVQHDLQLLPRDLVGGVRGQVRELQRIGNGADGHGVELLAAAAVAHVGPLLGPQQVAVADDREGGLAHGGRRALQERTQGLPLAGRRHGQVGEVDQRRVEVDQFGEAARRPRPDARTGDDQRHAGGLLVQAELLPHRVFAEVVAVVRGEDDDRVVLEAEVLQGGEDPADLLVHEGHAGVVSLEDRPAVVVVVGPADGLVPEDALGGNVQEVVRDAGRQRERGGVVEGEGGPGSHQGDVRAHEADGEEEGLVLEVAEQPHRLGRGDGVGLLAPVRVGLDLVEGGAEAEVVVLVGVEVEGLVRVVAGHPRGHPLRREHVVGRIPRSAVVRAGRAAGDVARDPHVVDLAHARGRVAVQPEVLGEGALGAERGVVGRVAAAHRLDPVRVQAGQDRGPRGVADRVLAVGPIEAHPSAREGVDVGRVDERIAVAGQGVRGQVVGDEEQDVRPRRRRRAGVRLHLQAVDVQVPGPQAARARRRPEADLERGRGGDGVVEGEPVEDAVGVGGVPLLGSEGDGGLAVDDDLHRVGLRGAAAVAPGRDRDAADGDGGAGRGQGEGQVVVVHAVVVGPARIGEVAVEVAQVELARRRVGVGPQQALEGGLGALAGQAGGRDLARGVRLRRIEQRNRERRARGSGVGEGAEVPVHEGRLRQGDRRERAPNEQGREEGGLDARPRGRPPLGGQGHGSLMIREVANPSRCGGPTSLADGHESGSAKCTRLHLPGRGCHLQHPPRKCHSSNDTSTMTRE